MPMGRAGVSLWVLRHKAPQTKFLGAHVQKFST